ncbi:hypothetical protein [Paenibacillus whitsoniae]|uniref:hypothetical protein n=1 Tax=Paenibacillus whitsoniae TaxID=2496558 RepID=UPI000F7EF3BC|nr:hypothetical protein [Paenibacillus whitsoniae]
MVVGDAARAVYPNETRLSDDALPVMMAAAHILSASSDEAWLRDRSTDAGCRPSGCGSCSWCFQDKTRLRWGRWRRAAVHVSSSSGQAGLRDRRAGAGCRPECLQLTYLVFPDEADFAIGAPALAAGPSVCSSRTWCFRMKPTPRSARRRRLPARASAADIPGASGPSSSSTRS